MLREKKTRKVRRVTLNQKVCVALVDWLARHPDRGSADAPLFPSERTGKALTVPSLCRLVKAWCRQAGIRGNHGSHTLRKTFGYIHRTVHGTDLPTLMVMFNHSSQRQTLDYLGIDADEVREAYLREI